MAYRDQRPHPAPKAGRQGAAYRRAVAQVRGRAKNGEPCWFWGTRPECPGPVWDWTLDPKRDPAAFTAHHLHRIMDYGDPIPDSRFMVPAHRGCNAWDGLRAQNDRRAGRTHPIPLGDPLPERTSRSW